MGKKLKAHGKALLCKSYQQYFNIILLNLICQTYAKFLHSDHYTSWQTGYTVTWRWWPPGFVYTYYYLDPSEVEDIWGEYYYGSCYFSVCYPTDMIIFATVCYGYSATTSGTPYMAKAFVDHGAAAFVGAAGESISSAYNDDVTAEFWTELCQNDETVLTAAQSYVDKHNEYLIFSNL